MSPYVVITFSLKGVSGQVFCTLLCCIHLSSLLHPPAEKQERLRAEVQLEARKIWQVSSQEDVAGKWLLRGKAAG